MRKIRVSIEEQDFILSIMLGYDRLKQCDRYLKRKTVSEEISRRWKMFKKISFIFVLLVIRSNSGIAGAKWAQEFYSEIESIKVRESIAVMLGSTESDTFEIGIEDVGMYIGHICPGVAGAYRATQLALKSLYGQKLPVRGKIKVAANSGSVALDVASYITGARAFYGCHHRDKGDLAIDKALCPKGDIAIIFQRKGIGKAVKVIFRKSLILCHSEIKREIFEPLKRKIKEGKATREEKERFGKLKQAMVRMVFFDTPPGIFEVEELESYSFPVKKER